MGHHRRRHNTADRSRIVYNADGNDDGHNDHSADHESGRSAGRESDHSADVENQLVIVGRPGLGSLTPSFRSPRLQRKGLTVQPRQL